MVRRLGLEDLSNFVMVSNPEISPYSQSLSYVVTRVEDDEYTSDIWIIDMESKEPLMFLSDRNERKPKWSPDGSRILYLSKNNENGKDTLYISRMKGESRRVTVNKSGIMEPEWSGDGKLIYFMTMVGDTDEEFRIIEDIPIWFNGSRFTYHLTKQLQQVDLRSGVVERVTDSDTDIVCYAPSNSGYKIVYARKDSETNPRVTPLFLLDLKTGKKEKILDDYNVASIDWSPDDTEICLLANDLSHGYPTHPSVYTLNLNTGDICNLTKEVDRGCSRRTYYDLRSPYDSTPDPVWDENYIYFPISDSGTLKIHRVNPKIGEIEEVTKGEFSIEEFSVSGGVVAYTRVKSNKTAELWSIEQGKDIRLTDHNSFILSELDLKIAEKYSFQASDGENIDCWILKPHDFDPDSKYPALVDIHGGPRSKFGEAFMFEHQFYSSNGYAVIYANIRGSDGYSQVFSDIRGEYGTRDFKDLIEAVDYTLEKYPWIDKDRIGVTGLSYGGFMTNWAITHTDRFATAISQNGISDWKAFFGTSDIGFHFAPDQLGGDPWSNENEYDLKSPIKYAPEVKTPVMFIHSLHDYRCWIDQSIQFFSALKYLGKKTRLALSMEGSHVFRSLSKPSIRRRRLEIMIEWFDEYLK